MQRSSRFVFGLVILCFLISGMAGLIYQLAWMRYLALFLGHTSYAVVAVLIAFMGGLAIGNAVSGIWADKMARPLAFYGWLELGIGVYALVFPSYYEFCHASYVSFASRWEPVGATALLLKFVFSLAAILFPAMLMGATLPVLTRFVTRSLAELREKVAALYFINSAGAVVGCIVADFWWIPAVGLELTVFGAGGLNLLAGLLALAISVRTGERNADEPRKPVRSEPNEVFEPAELRWAMIGIGASGFVAMLYEVAWTRLLALALGSSTHAFSLMLITFIAGIAAGAWVIYRWRGLRRTFQAFAWAEIALAVTVLGSMFFYELLPFWFSKLASLLNRKSEAYPLYQSLQALICFLVMFIPTLCLGLTLPLISRVATTELSRTGRSVGRVFAVNTLGTVLGTGVTGLWLMPHLGLARTFAVGVVLNAVIGIGALMRGRIPVKTWAGMAAGGMLVVWLAGVLFNQAWNGSFSLGIWRRAEMNMSRAEFKQMARIQPLKFARDGAGSSVVVFDDEKDNLALKVNGKTEAGTDLDLSTQLLIGHIPMLLRPQSTNALVVGLGSGMTAGAVVTHPSIQRLDVVEISPDVIEAARYFGKHHNNVHDNPKVRIVVDDAKSFLRTTTNLYDVVISEPSNPWMAGVAGVFTQEYYQNCRDRMRTNGLMLQWVQVYETNDETLRLVLRTFTSVFPFVSVWRPAISDLALVGSMQPIEPDMAAMQRRFIEPSVQADLRRIETDRMVTFLSRELVSAQNGAFMVAQDGSVHSDYFPELEYRAQEAFFVKRAANEWARFDENYSTRPSTMLGKWLQTHPLNESDLKGLVRFQMSYKVPDDDLLATVLHRWRRDFPQSTLPLELSSKLSEHGAPAELEVQRHRGMKDQLVRLAASDPQPLRLYAGYVLKSYRAQRSVFFTPDTGEIEEILDVLLEKDSRHYRVYKFYQAELAWDRGDDGRCISLALDAMKLASPGDRKSDLSIDVAAPLPVLPRVIESLWRAQRFTDAAEVCRYAISNGYAEKDVMIAAQCRKVQAVLSR
ncbi:MAG: hypothetical protein EXS31_12415 [Pedosphaera sp.]|nr:hypothetical protein [Pedosphaera sp.]